MQNIKVDPIAITGMGCRFPGGINCPDSFWEFLCKGGDGITEIPPDRWDLKSHYNPNKEVSGKSYVRKGGFLENIDQFDPEFFGISPREAAFMDPQQRLVLEVAWEAMEDGGIIPEQLVGTKTGVYVGSFVHDYENIHSNDTEYHNYGVHSATGVSAAIIANRISYLFDLRGPSLVIDTACSSSLVAVHLACRDLWNQDTNLALAGGVNLMINPEMFMILSRAAMLSPDGYCKTFDESANGYARAEGVGLVVLKRLPDALADDDPIYAVIRGTAMNQDGRSEGLTVPNEDSQRAVVLDALESAGIEPHMIQYVEAHGTGTAVGDPVEAESLGTIFSEGRPKREKFHVGSVKSNFGHTESAAGVAGLIKTALMLKHHQIPPNLHFETPNPIIPFDDLHIKVPVKLALWPKKDKQPRIAGINSFGFGGTNAHVIMEEFESAKTKKHPPTRSNLLLIPLSAGTREALKATAESYLEYVSDKVTKKSGITLNDIARAAAIYKTHHPFRMSILTNSKRELTQQLKAVIAEENRSGISTTKGSIISSPKLVFVCSGMGQQWPEMGKVLFEKEPVFKETIIECDTAFQKLTDEWSLIEELTNPEADSRIHETQIAQPCIFSLQVALAALWRARGIIPAAVVGHSVGEIAAFHIAGVLSLEDAVKVTFHRSRLQQTTAGLGTMLAVGLAAEIVEERISEFGDKISIGAINSSSSVTLSGDTDQLEKAASAFEKESVFNRFLKVEVPYHSPIMDPILSRLHGALKGVSHHSPSIPLVSTVTGKYVDDSKLPKNYWRRNVRQPVKFADALNSLIESGHNLFLELSAHPVLAPSMIDVLTDQGIKGVTIASMRRQEPGSVTMLNALGQLFCSGYEIDWSKIYPKEGAFLRLPSYPWQRKRFWNESEASQQRRIGRPAHPLLGRQQQGAVPTWQSEIDLSLHSYLADHVAQKNIILPGSAHIETALAAARELHGENAVILEDLHIKSPIFPRLKNPVSIQLSIPQNDGFSIHSSTSHEKKSWVLHTTGRIGLSKNQKIDEQRSIETIRASCDREITKNTAYQILKSRDLEYGQTFQNIEHIWRNDSILLAQIKATPEILPDIDNYIIHPALLDACFQVLAIAPDRGTFVPVNIESFQLLKKLPQSCWSYIQLITEKPNRLVADIEILDEFGGVLLKVTGLTCRRLTGTKETIPDSIEDHLYDYKWISKDLSAWPPRFRDASFLPTPSEIVRTVQPHNSEYFSQYNRQEFYDVVSGKIDTLCIAYIIETLQQLGWKLDPKDTFSTKQMIAELGIVREHKLLFVRLLEILEQAKVLRRAGRMWAFSQQPLNGGSNQLWNQILLDHPAYVAELIILNRSGSKLKEILTGEKDPLEIIFSPGSTLLEQLYQDSPSIRIYNRIMRQAVSMIVDHLPEGETLRVLEVGAGTGAITAYLKSLLPEYQTEYFFTDISPAFINQAEIKFRDTSFIKTQVLDIEKDPIEQGFEPHSFDLVLASDVLHATSDLKQSLKHIKKLLSSKGMIAVIEVSKAPFWLDLAFGSLKGWWSFTDKKLRPSHPIISQDSWINLLRETGFKEATGLSDRKKDSELTVLLAQGPRVKSKKQKDKKVTSGLNDNQSANLKNPWLLLSNDSVISDEFASLLEKQSIPYVNVNNGASYNKIDDRHYILRPGERDRISQLLNEVYPDSAAPPTILNFWNITRPIDTLTTTALEKATTESCSDLLSWVQALMSRQWSSAPSYWLVTNGSQTVGQLDGLQLHQTPLWGMRRVIVNEHPELKTGLVDLSSDPTDDEARALLNEFLFNDDEDEIVIRGNRRYVHRFLPREALPSSKPSVTPFGFFSHKRGTNRAFSFREVNRRVPGPGEVEVKVKAAALNFKDVAISTGVLEGESAEDGLTTQLGFECAGEIVRTGKGVKGFKVGDKVMGPGAKLLANFAIMDTKVLAHKTAKLTFEEAATIPIAFLTAYYALHKLAKIRKGERVLIHTATGGVGLAAIQVARQAGAEVFATAGSEEKRDFLRSLGINYVGDSRTLEFVEEIGEYANHRGVDIVINTLPGKAIEKSISLLEPITGRFIDISNYLSDESIDLNRLKNGVSFFIFDGDDIRRKRPELYGSILRKIARHFEKGEYRPLPFRTFPVSEAASAVGHLQKANHIGKVCVSVVEPGITAIPINDKYVIKPDGTYIITGGLGGLGLVFAKWLVSCGAKHLVLMGRKGAADADSKQAVKTLRESGIDVLVEAADVTNEKKVQSIIRKIDKTMPPLRGVIHTAMVLDITLLMQMTEEQLIRVMNPKILGAWNLHHLTLQHELDFFLLFSSFVSVFGFPGQANYSAANCFLNSLAQHRKLQGLPAATICWGAVGEAGYVARHEEIIESFKRQGIALLTPGQVRKSAVQALSDEHALLNVVEVNWRTFAKYMPSLEKLPRYAELMLKSNRKSRSDSEEEKDQSGIILPDNAEDRTKVLTEELGKGVAHILGVAADKLDIEQPFESLGIDSLMAVELGVEIDQRLQLELPKMTFLQSGLNLVGLVDIVEDELKKDKNQSKSQQNIDAMLPVLPVEVDFLKEAELGDHISPGNLPIHHNVDPDVVLLSGASGFLGAYLLKDIIHQTRAHVFCLVRAMDSKEGFERIKRNLQQYQIWEDGFESRITAINGDLTLPRFGLSDHEWKQLAKEVDVIFHNGAWLNFALSYSALRSTNVLSTVEMLKLACEQKIKPLHYISMMGAIAQPAVDPAQILPKTKGVDYSEIFNANYIRTKGFNLGYFQSKWVADELVSKASDRGLPTCIYRPTHISGDSRSGAWNTNDYTFRLIKGCIQMGFASDEDTVYDFSPVDYVSKAIVHLSRQRSSFGRGFILLNPSPINWNNMVDWISAYGFNIQRIPPEKWLDKMKALLTSDPGNTLFALSPVFEIRPKDHLVLGYPTYIESPRLIEKASTQVALKGSGISCPPADDKLLRTYFDYFTESGFLHQPHKN